MGDVGQAFTVYEKPWVCGECKADNFPRRDKCFKCKRTRPVDEGAGEGDRAALESAAGVAAASPWREAFDLRTRQVYYYNEQTRETSWARPLELGAAPYATGFFGRGAVGSTAQADMEAKNAAWLARPARKQAEFDLSKMQRAEGANEYNIWYGKFIGDISKGGLGKEPAPSRCDPDNDCGWTKASRGVTERGHFCLHFARGGCARGSECTFYHHIPTAADDGSWDALHDVFGRDRHTGHRDDMGGVGSFMLDCRTLYVGGIKKSAAVETLLRTSFDAWGEVEHLNFIPRLAIAFVRYRCRLNAEFALAAMTNQSLGHGEVLNVRWAYDDPNPVAKDARARADGDAVAAALAARGITYDPSSGGMMTMDGLAAIGPAPRAQEEEGEGAGALPPPALPLGQDEDEDSAQYEGGEAEEAGSSAAAPPARAGFTGEDAASFLRAMDTRPPALADYSHVPAAVVAPPARSGLQGPPGLPPAPQDPISPNYAAWYHAFYMPWVQAQSGGGEAGKRDREGGGEDQMAKRSRPA
jgi:hypothetical protein